MCGSSPLTRGKRGHRTRGPTNSRLIPAHAGKTRAIIGSFLRAADHPRSRGENQRGLTTFSQRVGSSPLTRGKHGRVVAVVGSHRLIPAHAGKTRACRAEPTSTRAYPRSRGENTTPFALTPEPSGSSPLTRGKLRLGGRLDAVVGLIPAHAGKTQRHRFLPYRRAAHPRSRGENRAGCACVEGGGSSPLTRGKRKGRRICPHGSRLIPAHAGKTRGRAHRPWPRSAHPRSRGENLKQGLEDRAPEGLIPAHAGKTCPSRRPRVGSTAHPRSRGENIRESKGRSIIAGSSPLTRGKHAPVGSPVGRRGLIPAHAGKTPNRWVVSFADTAHPHSRGENVVCFCAPSAVQGSSPLTRGKQAQAAPVHGRGGLIPAHAGKTRSAISCASVRAAHPRSRGENLDLWAQIYLLDGSSPLTRGKPVPEPVVRVHCRLIPAHAGKTSR